MGHLAAGMNAGVSTPRDCQGSGLVETEYAGNPRFQLTLHGAAIGLGGPPREVRPVIGDVQAPAGHDPSTRRQVRS